MSMNPGEKPPAPQIQPPQPVAAWAPPPAQAQIAPKQRQPSGTKTIVAVVVIAAVLSASLSIAGGWILYQTSGPLIDDEPCWGGLGIAVANTTVNWTLMVASISASNCRPSDVKLTIFDRDDVEKLHPVALSDLTLSNWNLNRALYQMRETGSYIRVGDSIIVQKSTYSWGYTFELATSMGILSMGTLR